MVICVGDDFDGTDSVGCIFYFDAPYLLIGILRHKDAETAGNTHILGEYLRITDSVHTGKILVFLFYGQSVGSPVLAAFRVQDIDLAAVRQQDPPSQMTLDQAFAIAHLGGKCYIAVII